MSEEVKLKYELRVLTINDVVSGEHYFANLVRAHDLTAAAHVRWLDITRAVRWLRKFGRQSLTILRLFGAIVILFSTGNAMKGPESVLYGPLDDARVYLAGSVVCKLRKVLKHESCLKVKSPAPLNLVELAQQHILAVQQCISCKFSATIGAISYYCQTLERIYKAVKAVFGRRVSDCMSLKRFTILGRCHAERPKLFRNTLAAVKEGPDVKQCLIAYHELPRAAASTHYQTHIVLEDGYCLLLTAKCAPVKAGLTLKSCIMPILKRAVCQPQNPYEKYQQGHANCTLIWKLWPEQCCVSCYGEDGTTYQILNYGMMVLLKPLRGLNFCMGHNHASQCICHDPIEVAEGPTKYRHFDQPELRVANLQQFEAKDMLANSIFVILTDHVTDFHVVTCHYMLKEMPKGLKKAHPEFLYPCNVKQNRWKQFQDGHGTFEQLNVPMRVQQNWHIEVNAKNAVSVNSRLLELANSCVEYQTGTESHFCKADIVNDDQNVLQKLTNYVVACLKYFSECPWNESIKEQPAKMVRVDNCYTEVVQCVFGEKRRPRIYDEHHFKFLARPNQGLFESLEPYAATCSTELLHLTGHDCNFNSWPKYSECRTDSRAKMFYSSLRKS